MEVAAIRFKRQCTFFMFRNFFLLEELLYNIIRCNGFDLYTLQGINISHLGKRKIIFKMQFWGHMLVPWRVSIYKYGIIV